MWCSFQMFDVSNVPRGIRASYPLLGARCYGCEKNTHTKSHTQTHHCLIVTYIKDTMHEWCCPDHKGNTLRERERVTQTTLTFRRVCVCMCLCFVISDVEQCDRARAIAEAAGDEFISAIQRIMCNK